MENFNFLVGDYNGACMTLQITNISFNEKCLSLLNYPEKVNIGIDTQNKLLAVKEAVNDDEIPVYRLSLGKTKNSGSIYSNRLRSEILKLVDRTSVCKGTRFYAKFDNEKDVLIVDLKKIIN